MKRKDLLKQIRWMPHWSLMIVGVFVVWPFHVLINAWIGVCDGWYEVKLIWELED